MLRHLPNILTISRFFMIPVIAWFLLKEVYIVAIAVILLSCFTDILDGYIARKFDVISDFGKLMDPLADKITQIALIATLTIKGIIGVWFLIILAIKDLIMIAGGSFLYAKDMVVSSNHLGKASTVLIYIALLSSMLIGQFNLNPTIDDYLYYIAIIITLLAFINYIRLYSRKYFRKAKSPNGTGTFGDF